MDNILTAKSIKKIIPHRYPFLLIDKVKIIPEEKRGIGYKNVTINEPFFQGHFPQEPIMPGVLIIEAMAQVGAVVILNEEQFRGKTAYFAGLNKVKFKRKVIPGDTLKIEMELLKMRSSIGVGKGTAFVEDEIAATGEFIFAIN